MAADTLRDQKQKIAFAMMSTDDMGEALNRVMVEVEQAIREEREKALREAAEFARHTSEQQDEKIAKLEGYEQTHLGNLDDLRAALADGPPGTYICDKCGFIAQKFMLRAADMAVGIDTREHHEVCPNDGTPMRRKTWKEDALDSDRVAREQMARADAAEAKLAEQYAQIAALTEQRDAAEDRQLERGAQLSELHGALAERDAEDAAANSDVCDILAKYEQSLAEKDAQIREWETGAVAASTEIVKLRQQIVALTEKADYFRVSRDKNAEALDAARVQIETLRVMLERCVGATVTLLPEA